MFCPGTFQGRPIVTELFCPPQLCGLWQLEKRITSNCFFVNKRTKHNLPFAWSTNNKMIKENSLGFHFPFDFFVECQNFMPVSTCLHVSISSCFHVSWPKAKSPCFHVSNPMSPCLHVPLSPCLHVSRIPQTKNGTNWKCNCHFFAVIGKSKQQTSVCCCKRKQKTLLCFPWPTNDKW